MRVQTRDTTAIAATLHFGYHPRPDPDRGARPWARVRAADVPPAAGLDRSALVARGLEVFRTACGTPGDALQVVPLSGGIDSRFLLAMLLEGGLRERIVAVTFGIPGTLDFEIAARVARAARVRHEALDLREEPPTRAQLLAAARLAPWSFLFEVHYNQLVFQRFGRTATYWSGILANAMAGADLTVACPDWASAVRTFARDTRLVRSIDLSPPGFRPESALPAGPILADSCLTYFEQLYLFVRYPGRNDPAMLSRAHDVRAPFRSAAWVDFMLRVPSEIRRGEGFYREIAARSNPALFTLPVKNRLGFALDTPAWRVQLRRGRLKLGRLLAARFPGRARRVDPMLNYVDFEHELRSGSVLAQVVEDSLQRLDSARVVDWIQPLELWRRHARRLANHGDALTALASLELNLAANGPPSP